MYLVAPEPVSEWIVSNFSHRASAAWRQRLGFRIDALSSAECRRLSPAPCGRRPFAMSSLPGSEESRWFAAEVQPHEPAVRAYLRRRFPGATDVDELIQESYLRMLRARQTGPIASAKAYLFTTARHLALALFRRPRIFSPIPVTDLPASRIIQEDVDVTEQVSTTEEIAVLLDAIDALPNRCREIFILRKLHGLSQKEIARKLGLSDQTVQVQVARGAKKCAHFLRRHGVTSRSNRGLETGEPNA